MTWKETGPMDQKLQFIAACLEEDDHNFAALCRRFNISRKTGYKWLRRYELLGPEGLQDLPPTPKHSPQRKDPLLLDLVLQARKDHPSWGPKKLRAWLLARHPELELPAPSTIGQWLKSYGLIRPRKRRIRVPPYPNPLDPCLAPNDVWCVDFKGHFALGDGTRCYPLTISDACSRYLLKCEALTKADESSVRPHFERCFVEFGLPQKIRSDNGPPFVSLTAGGLSALSVWWVQLGILPERIEPGHPEQNGRHERMHRTLKAETVTPPQTTLAEQQRVFDLFRAEYNQERPHEALGQNPPQKYYTLSPREYPCPLRSPEYSSEQKVRLVNSAGMIRFEGVYLYLTKLLAGEPVGLKEVGEQEWELRYGPVRLGKVKKRGSKLSLERKP